jgi:hypothetical protein
MLLSSGGIFYLGRSAMLIDSTPTLVVCLQPAQNIVI